MDPILDSVKQAEICAVLAVGGTRKMAARLVGCSPRTIRRTAARDPVFAERLTRTELSPEIKFLKNIADAAADKKYWRAAAWALERIHPNRYASRKPDTVSIDYITEITAYVVDAAMKGTPDSRSPDRLRNELTKIAKGYFTGGGKEARPTSEKD
jgi:hypothetical protein